jgi:hypothetical protein
MTTLRLATRTDDATLRGVLRNNGMRTWVEMTMEREPSFFAGADICGKEWAVLAEERGEVVGMYTAAIRPVYLDGRPERLGYLGGLRVNAPHRHRIGHLRRGYASIGTLAPARGTRDWWFTVIAAENHAARRLLEAGVPGLPTYHPLGEYVTFALPASRGRRAGLWRRARAAHVARILEFHASRVASFDLSSVLDAGLVSAIGVERFLLLEQRGEICGVAALWDQRAFKQIVARSYRRPIGVLVPAYNAFAKLTRRIPLPRAGEALDQTFVAFMALDLPGPFAPQLVLRDLLSHCETSVASFGLHAGHSLAPTMRKLKALAYPATVYGVSFDCNAPRCALPVQPEAALL